MSLHKYTSKLASEKRKIAQLPPEIHQTLISLEKSLTAEGLSPARILKYLLTLRRIYSILQKPFQEATREDIETVLQKIEKENYSAWTKQNYRVILKRFYKWLRKSEQYPPEVSWIKTTIKKSEEKIPDQLLTPEEVKKLVYSADNIRDKALIMLLYDSGARISEIGTLKTGSIIFQENYALVTLQGKTGMRRIPLTISIPYLQNWITNHPSKEIDAPLWVSLGSKNHLKPLSYSQIAKIIKKCAYKAGLKKRIHPHLFRHSRASELANHLTEAQMNIFFGWNQGSDMPRTYVHLSGRDIYDTILNIAGVKTERKNEEKKFESFKCPRCSQINQYEAKYCSRCGLILDIKEAVYKDETVNKMAKIIPVLTRILKQVLEKYPEATGELASELQELEELLSQ